MQKILSDLNEVDSKLSFEACTDDATKLNSNQPLEILLQGTGRGKSARQGLAINKGFFIFD